MNDVFIFLLALSGVIGLLIGIGIWWSIKSGQFEDMEGPAQRILMDDDDPMLPGTRSAEPSSEQDPLKDKD